MISRFKSAIAWTGALLAIVLVGCPDRGYQAPAPDYSNMTDGGSEHSEDTPQDN